MPAYDPDDYGYEPEREEWEDEPDDQLPTAEAVTWSDVADKEMGA